MKKMFCETIITKLLQMFQKYWKIGILHYRFTFSNSTNIITPPIYQQLCKCIIYLKHNGWMLSGARIGWNMSMTYILGKERIFYKDAFNVDIKHRLTQVLFPTYYRRRRMPDNLTVVMMPWQQLHDNVYITWWAIGQRVRLLAFDICPDKSRE